MVSRLLEYIDKELNRITNTLDKRVEDFEDMGVEYFLTHKAYEELKNEYIYEILQGIKTDLVENEKTSTKKEIVGYLKETLEYYRNKMLSGSVMPYNTNVMVNVVSLWKHEYNVRVINILKSLVILAENQIE
jgi:hypothetical protein